jgi:hypothetical protein
MSASAISNHFEHKYQEKLANWHDKTAVKELHIQLIDYYQDKKRDMGSIVPLKCVTIG